MILQNIPYLYINIRLFNTKCFWTILDKSTSNLYVNLKYYQYLLINGAQTTSNSIR